MSKEPKSTDCSSQRLQLSAYIDDQLATDEVLAVHAHLRDCPECAAFFTELHSTVHALRALPLPVPHGDPWGAILFTLRREGLVRPWWQRARSLGIGAATASMLVGLWAYSAVRPAPSTANLDAYWREHAVFTAQEEPAISDGAPSVDAIEANYQLEGSVR